MKSLEEGLKAAKAVVFANFQGLKVSEAEELRRECRKNNITVVAAKKTLVKRACETLGLTDINPKVFAGGVATFKALGDEVSAARIVNTFAKTHEVLKIFVGVLEGGVRQVNSALFVVGHRDQRQLPAAIQQIGPVQVAAGKQRIALHHP